MRLPPIQVFIITIPLFDSVTFPITTEFFPYLFFVLLHLLVFLIKVKDKKFKESLQKGCIFGIVCARNNFVKDIYCVFDLSHFFPGNFPLTTLFMSLAFPYSSCVLIYKIIGKKC